MFGNPQKVLNIEDERKKKRPKFIDREYMIFEKYDGWYVYNDFVDGKWTGWKSRTNRSLPSMRNFNAEFMGDHISGLCGKEPCRVICEAFIPGVPFATVGGILNRKEQAAEGIHLVCHDILRGYQKDARFEDRYNKMLGQLSREERENAMYIAPLLGLSSLERLWMEAFYKVREKPNGEGVVLKCPDSIYQPGKRNADMLKIKGVEDIDAVVTGFGEGKGKYEGVVGYLTVLTSEGITANISGMTDAQRDEWMRHPERIIGKHVEITAMKVLEGSLREGRLKCVREDLSQ